MDSTKSQSIKLVAVAVIALAIGFFAGREHLKYEMRSAFASAAEEMQKGFASIFSGEDSKSASAASKPSSKRAAPKTHVPQPLSVTLTGKDFVESDYRAGVYEDAITFSAAFENRAGKDIRAFEGSLTFFDLLDNRILGSKLAITDPVKAGATLNWAGQLDYNQFVDNHERLRGESLENLKTEFIVTKILFADGTKQEFK